MDWPTAVFACFSLVVVVGFVGFLVVYLKEYKREDMKFKELVKMREQQSKMEKEHPPVMYVVTPPAPKKKAPAPPTINKKNIN